MAKDRWKRYGYVKKDRQRIKQVARGRRRIASKSVRAVGMGSFYMPGNVPIPKYREKNFPSDHKSSVEAQRRAVWMARNAATLQCEIGRRAFVSLTQEQTTLGRGHRDLLTGDYWKEGSGEDVHGVPEDAR